MRRNDVYRPLALLKDKEASEIIKIRPPSFNYIKFVECRCKKAKYTIVELQESEISRQLFEMVYGRRTDKRFDLILSIIGSSQNFPISIKLKSAFQKGIVKIIESINNTLIITGE
jgi:hypothetical protein